MTQWQKVKLGSLCNFEKGNSGIAKTLPGEFPLVTTGKNRKTSSSYQFDTEAVCIPLVSSTGHGHASLKYVHFQSGKFALGTILVALTPIDNKILNIQFLHLYLSQLKNTLLVPLMSGAANVSLSISKIKSVEIFLPTIKRQSEIVALFNKNNENNQSLSSEITHQQSLLKKLRQAILQEAIEGKLTADWRKENFPPMEGWARSARGGHTLEKGYPQDGVVQKQTTKRNSQNYFSLPFNPKLKQRARELRKAGNLSEVLFWQQVKNKQFLDADFDRQKIIGNYIVDFYCANCQVVIEIDGSSHDDKQEYDAKRDAFLQNLGLTVIHIDDLDIKQNLNGVMDWLREHEAFKAAEQSASTAQEILTTPPLRGTPPKEDTPPRLAGTPPEEGNETGAELLEKIKAEKAKLIADKKIKKQKPLPPIEKDEIPFDIPENWVWCRLGEIGVLNPRNYLNDELNVGFSSMPRISSIFGVKPEFEIRKWKNIKSGFTHFAENDVAIAKITPCFENSKSGVFENLPNGYGAGTTELHIWRSFNNIPLPKFIYLIIKTSDFLENGKKIMKGAVGQKRVPKDYLENYSIPIPPLPEQKAIVEKVEHLFTMCDELDTQIAQNKQHADMLMQAVLKEVFESK